MSINRQAIKEPVLVKNPSNIKTWKDGYVDEYPEFSKIADEQIKIFWPWNEINVAKDKQDLLVGVNEAERHGIITTLKLFTKYELFVGNEHWGNKISKAYPHVGVQRMAAAFAHVELNSHAPFYDQINKELGLSNYKFYTEYLEDSVLSSRMSFISSLLSHEDDEISTAVFSLVEGAVLYSAFAYLKHFQSQGKNSMATICRGINMSARDEHLHSIGGAGLVNIALKEQGRTEAELKYFREVVLAAAELIFEHECAIIDKTFEKGKHEGVTPVTMKHFVESRINTCLEQLHIPKMYQVKYNPIADWFYRGINNYQMNDFFQGIGREYTRDWKPEGFVWKRQ